VPWSKFDLINAVNAWRRTLDGQGALWHRTIPAIVFEEAAADLARGLAAFTDSRKGRRPGPAMGFPRFKKKTRTPYSFRIRARKDDIAVGTSEHPRAVKLPRLGVIGVREDTRRLRRLLRAGPAGAPGARITSATVRQRRGRSTIAIAVEAPDLHPAARHSPPDLDASGWVGVDRGLIDLVVAATDDGVETARIPAGRFYRRRQEGLARRQRTLSRTRPGSRRRARALRKVQQYQARTAAIRTHRLHEVANQLDQSHDRLVLEHLHVAGMLTNHRAGRYLSRPGGDHHPDPGPASSRPGDQRATQTPRRRPRTPGAGAACGPQKARTTATTQPGA
jgi:putative transposase